MNKIEELKAAYEAATPGAWLPLPESTTVWTSVGESDFAVGDMRDRNDATFIALAHNAMPALLAAVELLQIGCEYASPLPPEFVAKVEVLLEKLK